MLHIQENSSIPLSWTSGKLGKTDSSFSHLTFQTRSYFEWEQLTFTKSLLSHLWKVCDIDLTVQLHTHQYIQQLINFLP